MTRLTNSAITKACRMIERSEKALALAALAASADVSRFHFHRTFKAITGVTPKAYAAAHRANRIRDELARSPSVTEAIYGAGFNSNSRFYAASTQMLGMTPTAFRAGGADLVIRFAICGCSLGFILVAATSKGVCAILLGDDPEMVAHGLQERFPHACLIGGDGAFERLLSKVMKVVETPAVGLGLPLDIRTMALQRRVWQALRENSSGTAASPANVTRRFESPRAVRALPQADAANPIALAIRCDRGARSGAMLPGCRRGVERRRTLRQHDAMP